MKKIHWKIREVRRRMLDKSGIYWIRNLVNGKIYIGSARNFKERWSWHLYDFKKNRNSRYLQRAWNKYKAKNFRFGILEYVDDATKLLEREQYYLDTLQPFSNTGNGYNLAKVAGSNRGLKFPYKPRPGSSWNKGKTGVYSPSVLRRMVKRMLEGNRVRHIPTEVRTCLCGCNETFECAVNSEKRFSQSGHNIRKSYLNKIGVVPTAWNKDISLMTKVCPWCHKNWTLPRNEIINATCCSRTCSANYRYKMLKEPIWNKGKPATLTHKESRRKGLLQFWRNRRKINE